MSFSQARNRQSTVGTQRTLAQLPSYEPPSHPLNQEAQLALSNLLREHSFHPLQDHYSKANACVTDAAGGLNERLKKKEEQRNRRKGSADENNEDNDDGEFEEIRQSVDKMTRSMENHIRKLIDGRQSVESMQSNVNYLVQNGVRASREAAATAKASQAQTQSTSHGRRRDDDDDDDDDEDMDSSDNESIPDPTLPGTSPTRTAAPIPLPSLSETYTTRLKDDESTYKALPQPTRYAQHNDYINFRRVVHASLAGTDAPLPHASSWFTSAGAPAPNLTSAELRAAARTATTTTNNNNNNDDDDDDDDEGNASDSDDSEVAVTREVTSLKCPLTLMPFENPVSSTVCRHSFERTAILELIRGSRDIVDPGTQVRRRYRKDEDKSVQCPVASCEKFIREWDLREDAYLKRMVRRAAEAEAQEEESGEEESEVGGGGVEDEEGSEVGGAGFEDEMEE